MYTLKMHHLVIIGSLALTACQKTQSNNPSHQPIQTAINPGDHVPYQGSYSWQFKLGPYQQTSSMTFHEASIDYKMTGKVYSTAYKMQRLNFDKNRGKWTGVDSAQNYYAMFIKPQSDDKLLIYKKKFPNDLKAALDFDTPAADDTSNHGWNIYQREGAAASDDVLPFSGKYQQANGASNIVLTPDAITYQGMTFKKFSHHSGERRWLGGTQQTEGGQYLLLFYDSISPSELALYVEVGADLEALYRTKHQRGEVFTKQ